MNTKLVNANKLSESAIYTQIVDISTGKVFFQKVRSYDISTLDADTIQDTKHSRILFPRLNHKVIINLIMF